MQKNREHARVIKSFRIFPENGRDKVNFRFQGSSEHQTAEILEIIGDKENLASVESILLNGLIHRPGDRFFKVHICKDKVIEFEAVGCVATELKRV